MAWTNPKTWNDGTLVTASDLNEQIRDNSNYLKTGTDQGHRILTTAQRDALTGVATGTMIYNSTIGVLEVWDGSVWSTPFPYLYEEGTAPLAVNGAATYDILWPAGFERISIDFEQLGGSGPTVVWQFLDGATLLSSAIYNYTLVTFTASYGYTSLPTATSVNLDGARRTTLDIWIATDNPTPGGLRYPAFHQRYASGMQIRGGEYQSVVTPTGIRLTVSGGPTANQSYNYRVTVQS